MLIEPKGKRDVTLIGTGSEVSLAVEAAKQLAEEGIEAAVVSMPCCELFEAQDESYRDAVLGDAPRVARGGRGRIRLGQMAWRERRLCRHARIWRLGAGARPI